jgi:general secretion pathway protein I
MDRRAASTCGFTLLEVLVALALLALTFAAALGATARTASDTAYLRDKTLATWVASNELTRVSLVGDWPAPGVRRGSSPMAGREWNWELRIVATADQDVHRLELTVGDAEGSPMVQLVGYLARPIEPPEATDTGTGTGPGTQPDAGVAPAPNRAPRTAPGSLMRRGPAAGQPVPPSTQGLMRR